MESIPFELRVLGPTDLGGSRPGLDGANLAPPKRVALLTYLAVETAAGYRRRDLIVGLFWPELDQEAARAQLRKALFGFRESLGADAVQTRGEGEVRLDPQKVWCDAVALGQYVKQGRWEEALGLYRGELLDGLFPEGVSQDFEEWLADKRKALREQAAMAAWECSRQEEADGDRKAAAVMARRALELTPDDETGVRQLMSLLDRQGDRASALRVYADWQTRLQAEYGVEPAPETRKLARKVQAARKGESHETPPVPAVPLETRPFASGPVAAPRAVRAGPRWLAWAGAGAVLAIAALAVMLVGGGEAPRIPPRSLAILPTRAIGGGAFTRIAEALAEELTTALILDTTLSVRSTNRVRDVLGAGGDVEELGRKLGVLYLVDGGVQGGNGRIRLTLRLVRGGDAIAVWAGSYDLPDPPSPADLQRVAGDAAQSIRSRLR